VAGESISALPEMRGDEDLQELCRLLTTFSQEELRLLSERISNPGKRASDLSEVLAEAVQISTSRDNKLANNLAPIVEGGISSSIKNNPKQFTQILAPVMGPAIRASILNALREYTTSMDRVIQNSISPQGLAWRVEAWRTGKTFGEIALYHTLEYKVEHIFLIKKSDGTLISHVSSAISKTEAPDAVSGMLTAIDDFVNDSFGVDSDTGLGKMQIGDLSVLISKGRSAVIAAVIRGEIPDGYRTDITSALDSFEFEYIDELKESNQDTSVYLAFNQRLIELLQVKLKHEETTEKSGSLKKICIGSLLLFGLGWYLFSSYLEGRTWKKFFEYIDDQPGIVITEIEKKGGFFKVDGLRDPLATDPDKLYLRQEFYDQDKVIFNFQPFHSLEREIVRQRVIRKFSPPDEVKISVSPEGLLAARGIASANWVRDFTLHAPGISGVKKIETAGLVASQRGRFDELMAEIEGQFITFSDSLTNLNSQLDQENSERIVSIKNNLVELNQLAASLSLSQRFSLRSYNPSRKKTDPITAVDLVRLDRIRDELVNKGVLPGIISVDQSTDPDQACLGFPNMCSADQAFIYLKSLN